MSRELSVKETHTLSHSMEQMCVNTPMAKSLKNGALKLKGTFLGSEDFSSAPLSPPPTVDTRQQKRERSESLMLFYTNEMTTTKRRLRSRSRIGFDEEGLPSMITPCSSKPKERTHRAQETMSYYSTGKHLNNPSCSVFMTPCSEESLRKPLQSRDLNSDSLDSLSGLLNDHYDYSSDSSNEGEFKTKLTFDEEEEDCKTPVPSGPSAWDFSKLIGRRMGEKKIDFIQELINLNCEEVCKKIFCYLEPQNLQRVASVSKLWRRICKKDRIASPRLQDFIHGRKQYVLRKGKENLGHRTKFEHKEVSHRPPFSVKNNTLWTPDHEKTNKDKETFDKIKSNIMSTYEKVKCPACGSPSRKLSDEDVCECEKCQEIFCQFCHHQIDEHHKAGKCAIKVNKSKKGKKKQVIGSKQSKSRLKRF